MGALKSKIVCLCLGIGLALSVGCTPEAGDGGDDGDGAGGASDAPLPADLEGLESITVEIQGWKPLIPDEPAQFRATGHFADGSERNISQDVAWSSSDTDVADFERYMRHSGAAVTGDGKVTITAAAGPITASLSTCTYPKSNNFYQLSPIRQNGAAECPCDLKGPIPYVYWETAYHPDGEMRNRPLRFADLHCDESVSIMIFVVGTVWCGACTSYATRIAEISDEIEAAGGRIVFIELENAERQLATSEEAQRHLRNYIGEDVGIRVGDADTFPQTGPGVGGLIKSSRVATGYPTVVIVRRSDMQVIADSSTGARSLDLVQVALNPDRDWTKPPPPMIESNCDGQEEDSEPNNTPDTAAPLSDGTILGGICDAEPDFYQVGVQGAWRFTVEFSNAVGNLDAVLWDPETNGPVRDEGGELVGSFTNEDVESFEHQGPALVGVFGSQYASAPYSLTFEAL